MRRFLCIVNGFRGLSFKGLGLRRFLYIVNGFGGFSFRGLGLRGFLCIVKGHVFLVGYIFGIVQNC